VAVEAFQDNPGGKLPEGIVQVNGDSPAAVKV